jgi:hypothetical protein
MNLVIRILLIGVVATFFAAPIQVFADSENCPCDIYWQPALEVTTCTSEIHLFNGMLRRDEVEVQGTILWWSQPAAEPPNQLICAKARTFRHACDLIIGEPEGTRCIETYAFDPIYFPKNKFFGKCKESIRQILLELNSLPSCD